MKNSESTRYFSDKQEKQVARIINGYQTANSGAGHFVKGDVVNKTAGILCECKCVMSEKDSISVKKSWIDKSKEEAKSTRLSNACIAINFKPDGENYFIIDEKLMTYLIECLEREES